jgi:putative ABC transport system permease protein
MALWRLSWKEMRSRPLRTLLTLLSIVIGVAAVLAVSMAIENTKFAQKAMLKAVAGQTAFEVYAEGGAAFEDGVLAELRKIPGVRLATGIIRRYTVMFYGDDQSVKLQYLGVDPKLDQEVREYVIVEGEPLSDYEQLLIDRGFAESLKLRIGQPVKFSTQSGLRVATIVGLIEPQSGSAATQGGLVVIPLPTAQRWARATRRVDLAQLVVDETLDATRFIESVQPSLPPGLKLRVPPLRSELGQEQTKALDHSLGMASAFSFIIGIFIIYNTFQMNVGERRRQLGILRALGTTRSQIIWMIVREGWMLGVLGTLVGWGAGLIATRWLTQATANLMEMDIPKTAAMNWYPLTLSAACGIGVALLGAFFPARRASWLSPAEAMRVVASGDMEPDHRLLMVIGLILSPLGLTILILCVLGKIHIDHAILGSVLFLLGYILMLPRLLPSFTRWILHALGGWLGVEGRLAERQLLRSRVRSALTIGILFIALSTGLGMASAILDNIRNFRVWSAQVLVGDFFVRATMPSMTTGEAADLPSDSLKQFYQIPGVKVVDTARYASARANELGVIVVARDFSDPSRRVFHITQGDEQQLFAGLKRGEVVLGSVFAERAKVRLGEEIRLETPAGPQRLKVAGIANDYIAAGLTIYMDRRYAEKLLDIEGANLAIIDAKPGRSPEVAAALKEICDRQGLMLHSQTEILKIVRAKVDGIVGGLWAVLALCSVIAAFGLINTLTMNILEQTAEIGVLRAVAMTRSQVRKMILSQAIFMGLIGLIPGVAAGLMIAYLLNLSILPTTGHAIDFAFRPGLIAGSFFFELLVVLLASLIPAERAARLPVAQAMQFR